MAESMNAYQLVSRGQPAMQRVPRPRPGPGQVLVQVGGVALCHTDLLLVDAAEGDFPWELPFTLGHEIAGWVAECGPNVEGLAPDDVVVLSGHTTCGTCSFCRRGADNHCSRAAGGLGFGRDGGLAEYVVVDRPSVVGPTTLDPREAAPLADSAATPYHAVTDVLDLLVGDTVAVVLGAGGLGAYAVQLLRLMSAATVIAVDPAEHRRSYAERLGAHVVLAPDELAGHLSQVGDGAGADAVLDMVGNDASMAAALSAVRPLGVVSLVGAGGGATTVSWGTPPRGASLRFPLGASMTHLAGVVALAEGGDLTIDNEYFTFDQVDQAYAALRSGSREGRIVLTPDPV